MWGEIARRSIWLSAGSAIGRLLPFVVLMMLGRSLSSEDFASASVGFAWTAVAASLTTAGLANVTTQRLALLPAPEQGAFVRRVVRMACLFSGGLLLAVLAVGPDAANIAFGRALDARIVWPALASGSLWSLVMLAVAICNGQHRPRRAASMLGIGGALQGAGLALGYALGNGAYMVLWGAALGNALALSWAIMCVRKQSSYGVPNAGSATATPSFPFGRSLAWSSFAAASVMPITFAAGSLVSHSTDAARQLAAFQALEQLHQLAIYLPSVLSQALLPVLTVHFSTKPGETSRRIIHASLLLAFAGSLLAAGLAWHPGWLHRLVGNPALTDPAATRAMLMNAGLSVALNLLGGGLLARGQYARATLLNVGWAAMFLGLGWIWREDGAAGVQIARLCASWALLIAASSAFWFGTPARRDHSSSTGASPSNPP